MVVPSEASRSTIRIWCWTASGFDIVPVTTRAEHGVRHIDPTCETMRWALAGVRGGPGATVEPVIEATVALTRPGNCACQTPVCPGASVVTWTEVRRPAEGRSVMT